MTLVLALITAMLGGLVSAMAVLTFVKHNEVDSRSAEKVALSSGEVMPDANVGPGDVEQASMNDVTSALQAASDERSQIAQSVVEINQRCELLKVELTELIERIQSLERIERGLNARLSDAAPVADVEELPAVYVPTNSDIDDFEQRRQARESDVRASLAAVGVDPQSIEDIGQRRDRFELARLELIDQATREGWRDSDQFETRLNELQSTEPDLRAELGEEAYDRYLFERGGPNRVAISSIIGGSAAEFAGLAPGDAILSYAGERIFRRSDLQAATRTGARGESVQLSVQRGADIFAVETTRGPLGVSLVSRRVAP